MKTKTKVKIIESVLIYLERDINKFCEDKHVKSIQLLDKNTAMIVYDIITE